MANHEHIESTWSQAVDETFIPQYDYEDLLDIYVISPSGYVVDPSQFEQARLNLKHYGFSVTIDEQAQSKLTRFAGTDSERALSFSRAALSSSPIVMASRGGYGLSRILPLIDWELLAKHPKRYCGFSDFTAFNLAYLAKTGLPSFSGPNLITDFAHLSGDSFNAELFTETMRGELEVLTFESPSSPNCDERGMLWGGNLCVLASLLGTPYFPQVDGGILFLEDVGEHPYRIERYLTSLLHAGVLARQKAIILGDFTAYTLTDYDNGYQLESVIAWLAQQIDIPIIRGLPYGHAEARLTLPVGVEVGVAVEDEMAYLLLQEHEHDHHCDCGSHD